MNKESNEKMEIISLTQKSPNNVCYIIKIYDTKILINVGAFDLDWGYLIEHTSKILDCNFCLISHCDLQFSGGLPFLEEIGFTGEIFATVPVVSFSEIIIKCVNSHKLRDYFDSILESNEEKNQKSALLEKPDHTKSSILNEGLSIPQYNYDKVYSTNGNESTDLTIVFEKQDDTIEISNLNIDKKLHIDKLNTSLKNQRHVFMKTKEFIPRFYHKKTIKDIFKKVKGVKYAQPIDLERDLIISAHSSGYSIGGTIWRIKTGKEHIVFVFNMDHRKESFIGGAEISIFDTATICFLDVKSKFEIIKKSDRNSDLQNMIHQYQKIAFFVSFSRIIEFVATIYSFCQQFSKKINVLCYSASKFLKNYQRMVEWFNSKINIDFHEKNELCFSPEILKFTNKLDDAEITIIPYHILNCFRIQKSLKKIFEDKNYHVIYTDESLTDASFESYKNKMPGFEYLYLRKKYLKDSAKSVNEYTLGKEKNQIVENEDFHENNKKLDDNKYYNLRNWYEHSIDFWITPENKQFAYFPKSKPKKFDEYGEQYICPAETSEYSLEVDNKSLSNLQLKKKKIKNQKIGKIKLLEIKIALKASFHRIDFTGFTEFDSYKRIFYNSKLQKIIFLSNQPFLSRVYSDYFSSNFDSMYLLDYLSIPVRTEISVLKLKNSLLGVLKWKSVKNIKIAPMSILIDENSRIKGQVKHFNKCYSVLTMNTLKNDLIENAFLADVNKNRVTVNSNLSINFGDDGSICIQGEFDDLYKAVRSIINRRIAFF